MPYMDFFWLKQVETILDFYLENYFYIFPLTYKLHFFDPREKKFRVLESSIL